MNHKLVIVFVIFLVINAGLSACTTGIERDPLASEGEQIFSANCLSCHPVDPDQPNVGPSLLGLNASLLNSGQDPAVYIEESIRLPGKMITPGYQNLMPAAEVLGLSDEEVQALVHYLVILE